MIRAHKIIFYSPGIRQKMQEIEDQRRSCDCTAAILLYFICPARRPEGVEI